MMVLKLVNIALIYCKGLIVVELKAIKNIEDIHYAIAKSYLRATGKEHGLLLNFAKTTLEVKRVINPLNIKELKPDFEATIK